MSKGSAAGLAIQLLGEFRIKVRGRVVEEERWPRQQAKLLVKILALEPKHQLHRQQLIDVIWPDLDAESGAANLHKMIHMARRALEPALQSGADSSYIVTEKQHVQLRSSGELWIDVAVFEKLAERALRSASTADYEAALGVYGGELLSDDRYFEWCLPKRDHLRALREQLLLGLGRALAADQQHPRAIKIFDELVAAAPANEDAHRQLMMLYVLTGRRSEALRQFQRCTDAVRQELDAEVEDATQQLYRRIVAREIRALPPHQLTPSSPGAIDAIAVLPFDNETSDAGLDYLASGIAESVIKNLSQVPALRVLAFSTVSRYRRRAVNPRKLGRELDAGALVTGRVSRAGDALVVGTELVHTADGSSLWSEQYRVQQTDVLAIQEEISREITEKLRVHMTVAERRLVVKRYTGDPEAYGLYLKGRFHWNKRTAEGLTRGIAYFEDAIRRDGSYALAFSGLADCYNLLSLYAVLPPRVTMPKARAAAQTALEIDPSLAEAHTSLAYTHLYFDWDWAAAEQGFLTALAINPNYATAHHWYHELLTALGRFEEQSSEVLLAQELEPLSLIINTDVGWGLYYRRAYDQAIEQLLRTLDLDANFAVAHLMLGLAYAQRGSLGEARASVQRAIDLAGDTPSTLAIAALGYVCALSGDAAGARQAVGRLDEQPGARYATDYCQAMVLAGLNDREAACERLERALEGRYDRLIYLNVDPVFDNLRPDARFQALIAAIGLTQGGS